MDRAGTSLDDKYMGFVELLMFFSCIEYIDKFYFVKTFFQIMAINESKEGSQAMKDLNKVQKLELELQDIQRNVIEIFDNMRKYEFKSKEREKMYKKVYKFIEKRGEILSDLEREKLNLQRSLASIDSDGEINQFFE